MWRLICLLLVLMFTSCLLAQQGAADSVNQGSQEVFAPLSEAFPAWERLNGPPGGYVERIEQCRAVPSTLYAAGGGDGLYKSTDAGESWILLPSGARDHGALLLVDPIDPNIVYGWDDGLARSSDGGLIWRSISRDFESAIWVQHLAMLPGSRDTLYVAGPRHDQRGCSVFISHDRGGTWRDIGPSSLPHGTSVASLAIHPSGSLYLGINDRSFAESGTGRVLPTSSGVSDGWTSQLMVSRDNGTSWQTVDYGATHARFIWSVYANPWNPEEVWVSEGPLHNEGIAQPLLYLSQDQGTTWREVPIRAHGWDSTQVRVIGAASTGAVYIAAGSNLLVTHDHGTTFANITPPRDQMNGVDFFDIEVGADDAGKLYLPLRSGGIAYSQDAGSTWIRQDDGIATISANLIETDPFKPGTLYVSSLQGQGVYRSDDYGETWSGSLDGIVHPWGDEIICDPHNEGEVWFIADVPVVHHSVDFGDTWDVRIHPDDTGAFNFGSIYAFTQGQSPDTIIVLDNGFGLFRGEGGEESGHWDWRFLRTSEVDYTYALATDPVNDDVLYAGYSAKPFQDFAMIRQSLDGGNTWETALLLEGADAVTSIAVNGVSPEHIVAAATGEPGSIWQSMDRGQTWSQPNARFNFSTIHSAAVAPSDPSTAYVGVWGGGTFVTRNAGIDWHTLSSPEAFSAAGIAIDPSDPDTIYIADRTSPTLNRSTDGGITFDELFDAGPTYARLMGVTVDPANPERLYAIAMETPTAMDRSPGVHGAVFRIEQGDPTDITGNLPRLPLSITVHPDDSDVIYAVTHGTGVFVSETRGDDWRELSGTSSGLPNSGFFQIVVDPRDHARLYLVGGCDVRFGSFASAGLDPNSVNGVYRSSDAGETWTCLNAGVLGAASGAVKGLAFPSQSPNLVLAAVENGLYISTDRGDSWSRDSTLPYATLGGILAVGDGVLALTNGAGVLRGVLAENDTIQWTDSPVVSAQVYFAQVIVDDKNPGTIYASGYPGGVFKSVDHGKTWHEANFGMTSFAVDDPLRQGYYALALAPSDARVLYLGLYGKGVYKSIDGAGTWMPMNGEDGAMLGQYVTGLTIDPSDADHVFVSTETGILRTRDGGRTWIESNTGMPTTDVRTIGFTPAGELFAGTRGYGLYRWHARAFSDDGQWIGQNPVGQWGVIWPMWNDRPRYQYSDMLFHATDDQRMMFGCFPAGIYTTADRGQSWRESNVGWTLDGVFSLIDHPQYPDTVYAGTYNGINRTLDFGEHWETWSEGWPAEQWVFRIAFDPRDPDIMYACSKNGENEGTGRPGFRGTVMKSINGGISWFPITEGLALDQEFYDIAVDPVSPDTLYLAAQEQGMFISTDSGASWYSWNQGLDGRRPATNGNNVTRVLALSGDARYLYFGTVGAGVYRREIHPLPQD